MTDNLTLFDSALRDGAPLECRYPDLAASSGYSYGCTCERCRDWNRQRWADRPKGPRRCAREGCTNPRRTVQGARYCDEHATSRAYEPVLKERVTCSICETPYERWRTPTRYNACAKCRSHYKPLLRRAADHNVDPAWLAEQIRNGLICRLCSRPLHVGHGSLGVHIDHDHRCCDGDRSCGKCIRGLLCVACNTQLGSFESLTNRVGIDAVVSYISAGQSPFI